MFLKMAEGSFTPVCLQVHSVSRALPSKGSNIKDKSIAICGQRFGDSLNSLLLDGDWYVIGQEFKIAKIDIIA